MKIQTKFLRITAIQQAAWSKIITTTVQVKIRAFRWKLKKTQHKMKKIHLL